MEKNTKTTVKQQEIAEKDFPGAAIDYADDNKVDPKMVKKDVKELNNNPRNNNLDQ